MTTEETKTAVQAEAEGAEITFEWLGHTVVLPPSPEEWDINATRAFQAQDLIRFLEQVVGPAEFARIEKVHRAAHGGKFLNRDLIPLGDKVAEVYGLDSAGN